MTNIIKNVIGAVAEKLDVTPSAAGATPAPAPAAAGHDPSRPLVRPNDAPRKRDVLGPAQKAAGYEVGPELDAHVPEGDPLTAWSRRQDEYRLVNPANRRKMKIIIVGTGLSGSGAAATLGQLGYDVDCFCFHDSPRRAHSVAAQGGINAARARKIDGDSLKRFVKDTVKGGDYRGREADAVRLGIESVKVIDHMYAIGAPFAREYGGQLATRSFGGVQVSRTYYTRGETGQQLEVACSQALQEQVDAGTVKMHNRMEMLDLVVADGRAQGIVTRDLLTGEVRGWTAHVVVLCTGGYGSVYHWSTLAKGSNATATWRAHRHGAYFASPCFLQFHPTALPVSQHWQSKTTLMSESLRNDGRIWVPKKPGDDRPANDIPENERDYYLERKYPSFGNLTPRDVASRNARTQIDSGHGVGPLHNSVYLDFKDAISRLGKETIKERYGNLFDMYLDCTGENPYEVPMRIAPGAHFSMGGLWVDFDQMSNIPGLFVGGEASNNYHGANRLGANSLLSASVDGWFTLPLAVPNYLAGFVGKPVLSTEAPEVRESIAYVEDRINKLTSNNGTRRPEWFHRRLGDILYEGCGVSRDEAGLSRALGEIRELREEFWRDVTVVGPDDRLNQELEKAGRVADFLELAEVMVLDALDRRESAGAHFRTEYATPEGEAKRNDDEWCAVSAWETRPDGTHVRHSEPLNFSLIDLQVRDYR